MPFCRATFVHFSMIFDYKKCMLFLQDDDEEDSGTKDENESIMEDDTTEDIVDEGNVSGSDEGNNLYIWFHEIKWPKINRTL